MDYNQTLEYLYSLEPKKWKLELGPISALLERLGNPHKWLKCIHVAGTNGKGSVCAMISSVLREAGYKTGRYNSPHLERFTERIVINGKEISEKKFVELAKKVKAVYSSESFFEFITSMAFLYFKEEKVDFVVLEVGLGGRLDATNVIDPLVSVITDIDLEHTGYLGSTIKKIAFEKSGIIKEGRPVITSNDKGALEVIRKISKEKNAPLYLAKGFRKEDWKFSVNGHDNPHLGLKGGFQLMNAAVAVAAIDVLKEKYKLHIDEKALKNGLDKAKWPGRFEFIKKNVLLDCAHNPAGMKVLVNELKRLEYKRLIVVVGILKDKDYKSMLRLLSPLASYLIITRPNAERAAEPEELAKYAGRDYEIIGNVGKAVEKARAMLKKDELMLVCGSIYTVGEARKGLIHGS